MYSFFNRRRSGGFTLIELLVVVLILAILMAVALPLYLSSQKNAELRTCRANMQTIANAVQAAKVSGKKTDYATFMGAVATAKEPDLQSVPLCPTVGTGAYTVIQGSSSDDTTYAIKCSETTHGTFEPGKDNQ